MTNEIQPGRGILFSDNHLDLQSFVDNTRQPAPKVDRHHPTYPKYMTTPDGVNSQRYQVDIDRMVIGGYAHAIFNMFTMLRGNNSVRTEDGITRTPDNFWAYDKFSDALDHGFTFHERLLAQRSDVLNKVTTKDELITTLESGKIAIQLSVEGIHNWEFADLERMAENGVRSLMGWNDFIPGNPRELWRPSKTSYTDLDIGVTPLGREFIRKADEADIILDGSHGSEKTILDMIDIVQNHPIIISHSGVYSIKEHKRNVSDVVLRALKRSGGMMGLSASAICVGSLEGFLDQIDYLVDMDMGDRIIVGTDFGGISKLTQSNGLEDAAVVARNIYWGMERRGHSIEQREAVLFKNSINFWMSNLK